MNRTETGKHRTNQRMQSIECFRLIAAMLVVFIHCEGSGRFGVMMNCLARVAVPYFFVVSGFFAYRVSEKTIRKRFWSVLKLTVSANLLYCLWDGFHAGTGDLQGIVQWLAEICTSNKLSKALLLNQSPVRGHLWYLSTIVVCYGVMWLYVRWAEDNICDYKPLYITGLWLFALHAVLGSFATASGFEIHYQIYRNALLFGLPMFALGIFLRENYDQILRSYGLTKIKLLLLTAVGAFLSILQWKGTGKVEMPAGTLLEAIALMLLLASMPAVSKRNGWISRGISMFGRLSTYIYVTHMLWADAYDRYLKRYVLPLGEAAEDFLYPFCIICLALTTGIVYLYIRSALNWACGKIRPVGRRDF